MFELFDVSALLSRHWSLPIHSLSPIRITVCNDLEKYRWSTLLTKEPETIEWIRNMNHDSVLVDIGANIGVYTMAALSKGIKHIYCFEPSPLNFSKLVDNISRNRLNCSVDCFATAISSKHSLIFFSHASKIELAQAEFHQSHTPSVNSFPVITSPMSLFSILFLSHNPTHIKIDVDGPEVEVLAECAEILSSGTVESVLIECSLNKTINLVDQIMAQYGFVVDAYYENLQDHSTFRRVAEGINVRNIVYSKPIKSVQ